MIKVPEIHVLFRIPIRIRGLIPDGIPIYWYGVMLITGFVAAVLLARRLARREGVPPAAVSDFAVLALVSGVLGARLWFVVEFANQVYFEADGTFIGLLPAIGRTLNISGGGLVFYGGLLAPILVLSWWFRRRRLPVLKMFDLLAPAAMLGLTFGRIGCFFNGCCFGSVCADHCAVGIQRPAAGPTWDFQVRHRGLDSASQWSLPVHPAQLYASAAALFICIVLMAAHRRKRRDGDVLALLLILYPAARFALESIREHEPSETLGFISISQAMSVVGFLIGVALLVARRRRPAAVPYVPPVTPPKDEAPHPRAGKSVSTDAAGRVRRPTSPKKRPPRRRHPPRG